MFQNYIPKSYFLSLSIIVLDVRLRVSQFVSGFSFVIGESELHFFYCQFKLNHRINFHRCLFNWLNSCRNLCAPRTISSSTFRVYLWNCIDYLTVCDRNKVNHNLNAWTQFRCMYGCALLSAVLCCAKYIISFDAFESSQIPNRMHDSTSTEYTVQAMFKPKSNWWLFSGCIFSSHVSNVRPKLHRNILIGCVESKNSGWLFVSPFSSNIFCHRRMFLSVSHVFRWTQTRCLSDQIEAVEYGNYLL